MPCWGCAACHVEWLESENTLSRGVHCVQGAIIAGIAITTIISWIPGHAASYLGPNSILPGEFILSSCFTPCQVQPSSLNTEGEIPVQMMTDI